MNNRAKKMNSTVKPLRVFALAASISFWGVFHIQAATASSTTTPSTTTPTVAALPPVSGPAADAETMPVTEKIQSLKKLAIELNRDLFILEEDLLFPANTQITVFLSIDVGTFFELDAVELLIDDEIVTSYLYTKKQLAALHKGGLQRLYIGNLKTGQHEMTAFFIGKGPKGEDYKRAATLVFEKGTDPKPLELQIRDSSKTYQAEFNIIEWQATE